MTKPVQLPFLVPLLAALLGYINISHAANAYQEICKTTTETEIAALFDRWNNPCRLGTLIRSQQTTPENLSSSPHI